MEKFSGNRGCNKSVDFLENLGVEFYKIASFELVDIPLIEYIASKGKPIVMSVGMGSEEEIGEALAACKKYGNEDVVLLKCCSQYPANYEDMNIAAIPLLKEKFGKIVGLSDHSFGSLAPIVAVAMGAQFIEKPGRGRFAYDNMLSYLIHIKYTDKHQYEPSEVYTARGESYTKIAHERNDDWLKGRAKIQVEKARIDADWLEEKILTGEVTKQQVMLTDDYFSIYARNKRRMEDAFDSYGQHKIYSTMQKMENGEFKTSVIFVTGAPHSGKSVFTEMLVKSIQKDVRDKTGEVWTVCTCASSNPFDEYQGEEILVMDDLRGMALTASDWLKLLLFFLLILMFQIPLYL